MLVPQYTTQKLAPMRFEIEVWPVVPPWIQGTMSGDGKERMKAGGEALFWRFQLAPGRIEPIKTQVVKLKDLKRGK